MNFKPLPLVYIASPYSPQTWLEKLPIIRSFVKYIRFKTINKLTARLLLQEGPFAFIGPITQSHLIGKYLPSNDGGFKNWAKIDFTCILRCDKIYVFKMKGWDKSAGVQEEIKFAERKKIPVVYINI